MWTGINRAYQGLREDSKEYERLKLAKEKDDFNRRLQVAQEARALEAFERKKTEYDRSLKAREADRQLAFSPETVHAPGMPGSDQAGPMEPVNKSVADFASTGAVTAARDYQSKEDLFRQKLALEYAKRTPTNMMTTDTKNFHADTGRLPETAGELSAWKAKYDKKSPTILKERDQFKDEMSLRKEYQASRPAADYYKIAKQFGRIDAVMKDLSDYRETGEGSLIAVDQTLINVFNKILDESSVVRESEYARTSQDVGYINQQLGKWQKLFSGGSGLIDSDRQAIMKAIRKFKDISEGTFTKNRDYFSGLSTSYNFDPSRIVMPFTPITETTSTKGNAPPKGSDNNARAEHYKGLVNQ